MHYAFDNLTSSRLLPAGIAAVLMAPVADFAHAQGDKRVASNTFNPAISVILDGTYANYSNDPEEYVIPGFPLGGELDLPKRGLGLNHSELAFSANIDDAFYGSVVAALHTEGDASEIELEEAFIETTSLGWGFTVKAGRFFSGIGYLNGQHPHTWDFTDNALAYRAMLGGNINDDGVQLRWVAPTPLFLEIGAEYLRGEDYPAGGAAEKGRGAQSLFAHLGGDVSVSHSWQVGLSAYQSKAQGRSTAGHAHGGGGEAATVFDGDADVTIFDFVWKWAPEGNASQRSLKLQGEYLRREEQGTVSVDDGAETSAYTGDQDGWYVQGVYQFMPRWKLGLRYDRLESDNRADSEEVLEEAGLHDEGLTPERSSIMVSYAHTEFSLLRLQYSQDDSTLETDDQWFLQYVVSLGAHGAHKF